MKYKVYHRTFYEYSTKISSCHSLTCLSPVATEDQSISEDTLTITPVPDSMEFFTDAFGNRRCYFNIPQEHSQLEIISTFHVEKALRSNPLPGLSISWRDLQQRCETPENEQDTMALDFVYSTPYTEFSDGIKAYASESFREDLTVIEIAQDLCQRIHKTLYSTARRPVSNQNLLRFLKTDGASVRILLISSSPASDLFGFPANISVDTYARTRPKGRKSFLALMPLTPGLRFTVPCTDGLSLTPPTIRLRVMNT